MSNSITGPVVLGPDGHPIRQADRTLISRRAFAGAALAAPFVMRTIPAAANEDEGDREMRELIGRIFYQGTGPRTLFTGIMLAFATGDRFYIDVTQGALQFEENRVGTQGILGGLAGLTRPTMAENLSSATAIGNVFLHGTMLVLMVASAQFDPRTARMLIAHRQLSWELQNLRGRLLTEAQVRGLPAVSVIPTMNLIGTLYMLHRVTLMALLPPVAGVS